MAVAVFLCLAGVWRNFSSATYCPILVAVDAKPVAISWCNTVWQFRTPFPMEFEIVSFHRRLNQGPQFEMMAKFQWPTISGRRRKLTDRNQTPRVNNSGYVRSAWSNQKFAKDMCIIIRSLMKMVGGASAVSAPNNVQAWYLLWLCFVFGFVFV